MSGQSSVNPTELWDEYLRLEKDFLDFITYVPLKDEHYSVWSPRLADLLLRIGSNVDSFCKNALFDSTFDQTTDIIMYRSRARTADGASKISMKDYQNIFETAYNLSTKRIVSIRERKVIAPYDSWISNNSPKWWSDYNAIKHDRFLHQTRATMNSALQGLGALFILYICHLETRKYLIDIDFFNLGGCPKERARGIVLCQPEPIDHEFGYLRMYGKSSLFGYVFEILKRPITDENRIKIFSSDTPKFDRAFLD